MISDEVRRKINSLSPTEREVLDLVCEGVKYKDIGEKIGMSESTVKSHMKSIRGKFGLDRLTRRKTAIEINNTYCSALKEIRDQSDKKKATEEESKVKPKPKPQDKEKVPVKEPEIEKDKEEDKEKETEKPKEDVIKKVDQKDEEKSDTPKPKPPVDEKVNKKKEGNQMKKTDQTKNDRFRSLKTAWRVISIAAIVFSGYMIYDHFFGTPTAQPASPAEEPGVKQEEITVAETEALLVDEIPPATDSPVSAPTPVSTSLPQPAILFEDNFDTGLSDDWEVVSGDPYIVNGMLVSDQDTWLLVGDAAWTNYSVEYDTRAKTTSKIVYGFNATAIRVVDFENMYGGRWTNMETQWFIVENGNWVQIPNSSNSLKYSDIINHRITVNGNVINVYINGVNHFSFVDSKYSHGRVGIMVHKNTQIDNFKVREILE